MSNFFNLSLADLKLLQAVWTQVKPNILSKLFDTLIIFLKKIFEKANFWEKKCRRQKIIKNYPACKDTKYSKTCLKRPLKKNTKIGFQDRFHLMQVKSIAECSPWSILQYFGPSLRPLPFANKIFVLSIFEWPLKTGFIVSSAYTLQSSVL